MRSRFRIGIDDAVILPIVLVALLARALYRVALSFLTLLSALAVTLLLQAVTFLLAVAATTGDGAAWLIKRLADLPQRPPAQHAVRHELVDRRWSGLRQRLSREAIATTAQSVLQGAISRVLQAGGALSPRAALLLIAGVTLWLPLSAAIAIAMHGALLAYAGSLPAWAQLLHPVATIIAKSKLVLLAAYPAAWPQAKKHAWVQAALRWMDHMAALDSIRKTAHRYRQTKQACAQTWDAGFRMRSLWPGR